MTRQTLDLYASFFLRCFLLCAALQIFVFVMTVFAHDLAYSMHSNFYDISVEFFDMAVYSLLGLMKTLGLVLFLIPWVALLTLRGRVE